MLIRITAAVPSVLPVIGLSSGLFVEWLKKASKAERLMEDAASAGVTAEPEPMSEAEVGVETTSFRVGNGRFNPVPPG